jgi:hypothetical protein
MNDAIDRLDDKKVRERCRDHHQSLRLLQKKPGSNLVHHIVQHPQRLPHWTTVDCSIARSGGEITSA